MRKCHRCDFQGEAMLDYCWQCGTQLVNVGQFYQGAARTREYSVPNQQLPPVNNGYGQNYQPRQATFSVGRIAAVLGGFFLFLLFIAGAGAAVVYRVVSRPPVPRYEPEYRYRNPEPQKPSVKEKTANEKLKSGNPSAAFQKIWVDYDVRQEGRLGMRIHVKFSVYNMKEVDSYLAIYFEKADGTKLTGNNRKYSSTDGQTAVFRLLKPGFEDTIYNDLKVFMPYDELNLANGKHDLKMDVDLIYENGDIVEHLGYHDFQYEKK